MMRRPILLALAVAALGTMGLAQGSWAGTTYDFAFRPGGGGVANGNQYTFASEAAAQGGSAVADVFLITSDALIFNSISVGFDNSKGLAVAAAVEWSGTQISFFPGPVAFYAPIAPGVTVGASTISSFDGTVPPPNGPPSLSPGTYNIGTIIWDTSSATQGLSAIGFFLRAGFDATGAVLPPASNNIVNVSGTEVLNTGFINIVPEPGTAGLLSFALVGLTLSGRRRALRRSPAKGG